ncbi:MAG: erythromycin esterase family protein [Deltaproteobacteria bacterium]|nr:MAG: erythromycin esterase family protein [Deltaproteobacteria bacterium]
MNRWIVLVLVATGWSGGIVLPACGDDASAPQDTSTTVDATDVGDSDAGDTVAIVTLALRVDVHDALGVAVRPGANLSVALDAPDGAHLEAVTDGDGQVTFADLDWPDGATAAVTVALEDDTLHSRLGITAAMAAAGVVTLDVRSDAPPALVEVDGTVAHDPGAVFAVMVTATAPSLTYLEPAELPGDMPRFIDGALFDWSLSVLPDRDVGLLAIAWGYAPEGLSNRGFGLDFGDWSYLPLSADEVAGTHTLDLAAHTVIPLTATGTLTLPDDEHDPLGFFARAWANISVTVAGAKGAVMGLTARSDVAGDLQTRAYELRYVAPEGFELETRLTLNLGFERSTVVVPGVASGPAAPAFPTPPRFASDPLPLGAGLAWELSTADAEDGALTVLVDLRDPVSKALRWRLELPPATASLTFPAPPSGATSPLAAQLLVARVRLCAWDGARCTREAESTPVSLAAPPPSEPLPDGVYGLGGAEPTLPADDLAPLADLIGDARLVALGESVHYVGGFQRMKHRVLRYLVEELGFRAVAFETTWARADAVNAYVASCDGDLLDTLVELWPVWRSREVEELLVWLCEYNQAHPEDPVGFFGFDVQEAWTDAPPLVAYVDEVIPDPTAFDEAIAGCPYVGYTERFPGATYWVYDHPVPENGEFLTCVHALDELEAYFTEHEAELVAATSAEALALARVHLVSLRAGARYNFFTTHGGGPDLVYHEAGMAEVLRRLWELRYPGKRVAVWAHNWHIATHTEEGWAVGFGNGARSMGSLLAEDLGSDYVSIALAGYWAADIANGGSRDGYASPPSGDDDVEALLGPLGHDALLVDLHDPGAATVIPPDTQLTFADWLRYVPAANHDALLFLHVAPTFDPRW